MAPEAGVPSAALYRGSIAALLLGTAVAVFLIVSPPEDQASGDEIRVVSTPTSTPVPPTSTRAPADDATPTPREAATPTPPVTEEPGVQTHTVVSGETPSEVAALYGVTVPELQAANPEVDFSVFPTGTVLVIPGGGE